MVKEMRASLKRGRVPMHELELMAQILKNLKAELPEDIGREI